MLHGADVMAGCQGGDSYVMRKKVSVDDGAIIIRSDRGQRRSSGIVALDGGFGWLGRYLRFGGGNTEDGAEGGGLGPAHMHRTGLAVGGKRDDA